MSGEARVFGDEWKAECVRTHGRMLTGNFSHWCMEWDFMAIDETTREFSVCRCYLGAPKDGAR